MRDFSADQVIVVTHPRERETWQEQGELERLRRELDVPVTHVMLGAAVECLRAVARLRGRTPAVASSRTRKLEPNVRSTLPCGRGDGPGALSGETGNDRTGKISPTFEKDERQSSNRSSSLVSGHPCRAWANEREDEVGPERRAKRA